MILAPMPIIVRAIGPHHLALAVAHLPSNFSLVNLTGCIGDPDSLLRKFFNFRIWLFVLRMTINHIGGVDNNGLSLLS